MKTSFEKYIEANLALSKCYEAVPFDKYKSFSHQQQEDLCKAERETVRGFLTSNQVAFANLIQERLQAAGQK
jgi:hypothetical protein